MNDPNGLFFVDGRLHVTYQLNPDSPAWGRMHWGHAETPDLVTWRNLPMALSPEDGTADEFGCWSGSIVDGGAMAQLFYTGARLDGDVRIQTICRATSRDPDRLQWTKDPGNPIIAAPPDGIAHDLFRDPFVWRDGTRWQMLVGAGTIDGHACVLRYQADDPGRWRFAGPILSSDEVDPAAGGDGPMWECPQLLRFDETDVLVVSVVDRAPGIRPSHVMAFVGRLGEERFVVDHAQQLGMGPDFYAPAAVRMPDGRCLMLGWIPEDPPGPASDRTWAGALTFPRIVTPVGGGRLSLALADEVRSLRGTLVRGETRVLPADGAPWPIALPDGPFELVLELEPDEAAEVVLELRDDHPEEPLARVAYQAAPRLLSIARRGIVSVAGRSSRSATTLPASDGATVRLRIILDGSILEMETNGHTMATTRLPSRASAGCSAALQALGGAVRIQALEIWQLGDGEVQ
jgi:beta-fructofuranosidase